MLITCPNCSSRFVADPQALMPSGRQVRCGQCATTWFQPPAAPEPPPAPPPAANTDDVLTTPVESEKVRRVKRRSRGRWLTLFFFVFVLAVLAFGLYKYRDFVVEKFPWAARYYEMVGFGVNRPAGFGLHVPGDRVKTERGTESGEPILIVTFVVVNETQQPQKIGRLLFKLLGPEEKELRQWVFTPPDQTIDPGKELPFKTSVTNPPAEARKVSISFISNN